MWPKVLAHRLPWHSIHGINQLGMRVMDRVYTPAVRAHLLVGGELLGPQACLPQGGLGACQPQLQVVAGGLRTIQARLQPADLRQTGFA